MRSVILLSMSIKDTEALEIVKNLLSEMLTTLGFVYSKIEVTEEKEIGSLRANISSDEAAFLIGTHGERLNALQYLLKSLLWQKTGERSFVIVDVDHYRKQREERFIDLAKEKAVTARETNYPQAMPPLEPYLRRVVHLYLLNNETGVTTESEGEGAYRHVVIKPTE